MPEPVDWQLGRPAGHLPEQRLESHPRVVLAVAGARRERAELEPLARRRSSSARVPGEPPVAVLDLPALEEGSAVVVGTQALQAEPQVAVGMPAGQPVAWVVDAPGEPWAMMDPVELESDRLATAEVAQASPEASPRPAAVVPDSETGGFEVPPQRARQEPASPGSGLRG